MAVLLLLPFFGCSKGNTGIVSSGNAQNTAKRDNTPRVLTPSKSGTGVFENEYISVDTGNAAEGYIIASYKGSNGKVKFRLQGENGVTYTYDLANDDAVLPLASGSGSYHMECFENIEGDRYATVFAEDVTFPSVDEFKPYLYPNKYISFTETSSIVPKASEVVSSACSDLDAVASVYEFVSKNITYDYNLAKTVESGYSPNVDRVLSEKTGICFDYAALMTAMLRSQGIPTRLEVGYAADAYHAWISTYITDVGWVNGMIEFDGHSWTLMDPTFAANSGEAELKEFIGNGNNYVTKYIY